MASLVAWVAACAYGILALDLPAVRGLLRSLAGTDLRSLSPGGIARACGVHLVLICATAAYVLGLLGLGKGVVVFLSGRGPGADRPHAARALLGMSVLGTGFLALSLVGLVGSPPAFLVLALGVVMACVPGGTAERAGRVRDALRRLGDPGSLWIVPALLLVGLYGVVALVPDNNVDVYSYHLAVPERLLRAHKFVPEGTGVQQHFPLAMDLGYLPAVSLGLDALPHLVNWLAVIGVTVVVGEWASGVAGPGAGWAVWALLPTSAFVGWMVVVAKNDILAASCQIVGIVLLFGRWPRLPWGTTLLGAALLGSGAAGKPNGGIAVVVAGLVLACGRAPARKTAVWLAGVAIAWGAWPLKSWLMMGDPLWPVLSGWLPGSLWDAQSGESLLIMRGALRSVAAFPADVWRAVALASPGLCVAVPVMAVGLRRMMPSERVLAFCAIATGWANVVAMPCDWPRYSLPAWCMLAAVCATAVGRVCGKRGPVIRKAAILGLSVAAWFPIGHFFRNWVDPAACVGHLLGGGQLTAFSSRERTTMARLSGDLARLRCPGKTILIGDPRTYRLPGMFLAERSSGRNWAWLLARECRTPRQIARRLREAGCGCIVYNFITETYPHSFATPFRWDDRMVSLWTGFVGRYLEVVVPPSQVDHLNGGFCVYRIRERPRPSAPPFMPYLPGIQSVFFPATSAAAANNWQAFRRESEQLYARLPRIGSVVGLLAQCRRRAGDCAGAYLLYKDLGVHGATVDDTWIGLAACAARLGKQEEALQAAETAIAVYPEWTTEANNVIAASCNNLAFGLAARGGDLRKALMLAERSIRAAPDRASGWDTLGIVQAKLGLRSEAVSSFGKATALANTKDESVMIAGHVRDAGLAGIRTEAAGK